eukprot:CAMPEP_0185176296 /NCGR_PEP_ID=MMETSP1139-20130426/28116_1 /TAXON_ID=298111 /ORGANISM="Pavlova sp., Strain CCMP459" /LENGTH=156 /DNA_ID=CAMNT_0027742055 /DNA_START=674 /DNA_END=1141 /DNA_ORIENTATION=-
MITLASQLRVLAHHGHHENTCATTPRASFVYVTPETAIHDNLKLTLETKELLALHSEAKAYPARVGRVVKTNQACCDVGAKAYGKRIRESSYCATDEFAGAPPKHPMCRRNASGSSNIGGAERVDSSGFHALKHPRLPSTDDTNPIMNSTGALASV